MKLLQNIVNRLRGEWALSIRRQLAWSFSLVALAIILISGYFLYSYQRHFQYAQGTQSAQELAQALAVSSTSWVLANDLVGLQEILQGAGNVAGIRFIVVLSPKGEVLASTLPEYIDRYFSDAISQRLLTQPAHPQILQDEANLIDVAAPVVTGNRLAGWVRVVLTRDKANANLREVAVAGFAIASLLVLMIVLISIWLAGRLTRGLGRLSDVANDAEHGRAFRREDSARPDEVGVLARHLYRMLDAREAEEKAKNESEARFQAVFNNAAIGLAQVSTAGRFMQINQAFCKIIGYTQEEVLLQDFTFQRITFADDLAADMNYVNKLRSGELDSYTLEKRYIRKDGTLVWVNLSVSLLRDDAGHPLYFISAVLDSTEWKRAEEELKRYKDHLEEEVQQRTNELVLARDAAEAANRAKSVFLSNMSHELRTPLNAILGFSSMMHLDKMLSEDQRENLDIINRSGEHLLTLINDVLEMAKIEAGRVQVEIAPFDLGNLVRDVTDMMHLRAQEKGLQLLIDQSSEFPRYIKGDEARLRQVLINLVGNAVKFTPNGGITLRFGMKPHTTPQRLLIEVEDSGIGINAADQLRIFDPFIQVGELSEQQGTGLGLTITRQFVQLMGGEISVTSSPGAGSTFRVELPAEEVEAADISRPEKVEIGEVTGLAAGQPEYRILIVEDQLENQLLLSKLMKNLGFQVKVAQNGQQGVALFQSWQPQLIWMDRRMPVMDGLEATRRIRELPGGKEVKIVAVTASAFMEQRAEMLAAGMNEFVRKPYRFKEIYECLTRQLGVQYTYADMPQQAEDVRLSAEMLAELPSPLRRELRAALESLDEARINAAIEQITDARLHKTLSYLADNFDYPAILNALEPDQMVNVI